MPSNRFGVIQRLCNVHELADLTFTPWIGLSDEKRSDAQCLGAFYVRLLAVANHYGVLNVNAVRYGVQKGQRVRLFIARKCRCVNRIKERAKAQRLHQFGQLRHMVGEEDMSPSSRLQEAERCGRVGEDPPMRRTGVFIADGTGQQCSLCGAKAAACSERSLDGGVQSRPPCFRSSYLGVRSFGRMPREAGLEMRDEIFTPMTSLPYMPIGQISQALRPEPWALSKRSVKVPDGEAHGRSMVTLGYSARSLANEPLAVASLCPIGCRWGFMRFLGGVMDARHRAVMQACGAPT